MGLIGRMMSLVFGGGSAVGDVVEIFRENTENSAVRQATGKAASLQQFAAEFQHQRRGLFDRFVDGLNRLPRPCLALGTIGLFIAAMSRPDWFASRMTGVALIPEPLWWLMGAIVSFYFGARHQVKGQEFQRSVVETLAMRQAVTEDNEGAPAAPVALFRPASGPPSEPNAALEDWRAIHAA